MSGTIVALAPGTRTGTIRAEDGSRIAFSAAVILGDFDTLAVGDWVSFDVDPARPHQGAVNVFRQPVGAGALSRKPDALPDLRYMGFSQQANVRSYRFDVLAANRLVQQHVVTVDLALMMKHRICVQEAPALCLRKLAADLKDPRNSEPHELGDDELFAFASSRAAALERRKPRQPFIPRRGSPPPVVPQDRRLR